MPEANYLLSVSWGYIKVCMVAPELFFGLLMEVGFGLVFVGGLWRHWGGKPTASLSVWHPVLECLDPSSISGSSFHINPLYFGRYVDLDVKKHSCLDNFRDLSICTGEAQKIWDVAQDMAAVFLTYLIIYAFVYLFISNIASFWNNIIVFDTYIHTLTVEKNAREKYYFKLLQTVWKLQFTN